MLEQPMEMFQRLNNAPWGLIPLSDNVVRWNHHPRRVRFPGKAGRPPRSRKTKNVKPVESSGGNGSQSWLSDKDSKLQQF